MEPSQGPSNRKQNPSNSYLRYSSLAFQLLVVIAVFGWIGYRIDLWLDLKFPAFMLLLGFLGFGGMLYQVYKSFNQP